MSAANPLKYIALGALGITAYKYYDLQRYNKKMN
jgi:hypothetical protein